MVRFTSGVTLPLAINYVGQFARLNLDQLEHFRMVHIEDVWIERDFGLGRRGLVLSEQETAIKAKNRTESLPSTVFE